MIREVVPQPDDSSHDRTILIMQGTRERDEYLRSFPRPIPDTHELTCEWDETGMRLVLAVRPRLAAAVAGRASSLGGRLAAAVDAARRELEKLKREDLLARAAELGLGDKIPGSATKAQIIALIVKRLDEEGLLESQADPDDE